MRRLLSPRALSLILVMATLTMSVQQDRAANANIRERLVGAWKLAWLEEPDVSGSIRKADCSGLLVYTSDGHMSVQVMYRNPPAENKASPVQYAQSGYEASFGKYEIEDAHTFTFHVEGALVRTLIGKDLKRVYELTGGQLIVKSPDPNEHWRVAWERD
jgi:hypothetical protein